MKKFLFTSLILLLVTTGFSQLNNSWIDYTKTYYKFKVSRDSLCRIAQPVLAAIGLGSVPAQNFQLWRNGKEVRLYTSVSSGVLGAGDYIEFWGERNDGKPDKTLFRNPDFQLNDKYNLNTDTATYFLTVNTVGINLRYLQSPNVIAGNTLPADIYFMRRAEVNYREKINRGYAAVLGEYVYSSSYDIGEGWTSNDIAPCCALTAQLTDLNVYTSGPPNSVMFTVAAAGNALNTRELSAKFFNTTILGSSGTTPPNPMPFFDYHKDTVRNIPLSLLLSPSGLPVSISTNSTNITDRFVVGSLSVTYPATFNFNNQKNFYFELKNNAAGNYLVIDNFFSNAIAPVLYDINNGKRYLGDINTPGQVKFVLPPSADPVRKFNLISQDPSNINIITGITSKSFFNLANSTNQGDYLIISNPVLYNNGSGVNNVDLYRQYRASSAGGNYNSKIYDINELTDQFGFGISKHPTSVRDFIRYADQQFTVKPKYVFIIGHGLSYIDYNAPGVLNPIAEQLSLVPTFGWPPSDILLSCNPGTNVPLIPIGRIGAINGTEVGYYLDKMKQYEQTQQSTVQTIANKAWMKSFLFTIGGADSAENAEFGIYMNGYKIIVEDTMLGAHVETFAKSSNATIEQQQSQRITQMFQDGLGYVKYFGHSSANELAINLNYPETYNNAGKYPFMHVSGCTVGNFFNYNVNRVIGYQGMSLSEKYVLIDQKGSIGFLGSTHFGIAPFLNFYNNFLFTNISSAMYGNTIGNQIKNVLQSMGPDPNTLDFYTRIHMEEVNLQGDPALKVNSFAKPDYVIEDQLVKFTPTIISVANANFIVDIKMMNIGKAVNDSIRVTVKQKIPTGAIKILYNQRIRGIHNLDSIHLVVPINPITDKGLNQLIISLDDDFNVDELSESNNILIKDFYIFEDELRPVYPYNYSIVKQQNISYYASTTNAVLGQRQYTMEIDTTESFNSPLKKTYNLNGVGGIIQFSPTNITFADSTVYYWRTATVPIGNASYIWNSTSFIYLPNSSPGSNQSHYYQHIKSVTTDISFQPDRKWKFDTYISAVKLKNGIYPTAANQAQDFQINVDGGIIVQSACAPIDSKVLISVFNPIGFDALPNSFSGPGLNGSNPVCGVTKRYSFAYDLANPVMRRAAVRFLDSIPNSWYIVVMNVTNFIPPAGSFVDSWKNDTLVLGSGNSLYHRLKNAGFLEIDSFIRPRAFNFIYKKGDNSFIPVYKFSEGISDKITSDVLCPVTKSNGTIISPAFGPAKTWSQFHWRGARSETTAGDSISFNIIGVSSGGTETTLYTIDSTVKDFDISAVSAAQYPYIKLKMFNRDKVQGTPYQLSYWRLNYAPVPEGAVAPNILFSLKDTADQGEIVDFKMAFKNISPTNFDSLMKINFIITDRNNLPHPVTIPRGKILISGDTLVVNYKIDTRNYPGSNTVFVDINPGNDQPEEFHFNNILVKELYVKADNFNPLLDITFDGVHILNKDIVSAKPHILINLKDESRFLALADTALLNVQVRFPDGSLRRYYFGDSMRFTPANLATGVNTAVIDFLPWFPKEGEYELIVSGKDVVGNTAGTLNYHVIFTVITKAMISNLLNYPNPFTTSTAFVFTITGNEVPQNIRIQVLTITGKIVREITKDELGPLHVGRNITEFKWDGTDTYGAKLANGVYLYRVLTNLNGKSLEKYKADGDNTDKYFNKGYGKMVIIR